MTAVLGHEITFDSHAVKHGRVRRVVFTASCRCGCGRHWSGYGAQDVVDQVDVFFGGAVGMSDTPQCPAVNGDGNRCGYVEHPGIRPHVDLSSGWPSPWMVADDVWQNVNLAGGDQERDAPASLRTKGNR